MSLECCVDEVHAAVGWSFFSFGKWGAVLWAAAKPEQQYAVIYTNCPTKYT